MSLQVWLPLNRDLSNYGLCNVSTRPISSASVTTNGGGKLGNCLSISSDGQAVSLDSYMDVCSTYTRYSMSAWIYLSSTATNHSSSILSSGDWNSGSSQLCFGLYSYSSDGYYKMLVPNRSSWSSGIDLSNPIKLNTWYNICITYDGNSTKGYVNSEYVGSYAGGGITSSSNSRNLYVGSATYYSGFTLKGSINDVRIYDHCLSAKEVKEISKGLVCHYKLDNNGFGNPNLITTMTPGGRTALNGKYGLNADFSQNLDTYGYFNVSPALELNSAYTLSFDVSNFPRGGAWSFNLWNNANYSTGTITKDGHYTYTFVPSESKLPNGYSLTKFLFDDAIRTNPAGTVYFTNFKIEKGDRATSWCPHTSDSLYTSLGLDSTAEPDCSGYLRNANKVNSPASLPGSPRYEVGCKFTGSEYLTFPNPLTPSSTEFSISCWVKFDNASDTMTICTMRASVGSGIALFKVGSNFRFDDNAQTTFSDYSIPVNIWLHLVVTRSLNSKNLYVNGNLVQSTTTVGDMRELYTTGSIGASSASGGNLGNFTKGAFSDFRIYSTALSASDVKELYNTSASVDKNGNMYAYEFKEE